MLVTLTSAWYPPGQLPVRVTVQVNRLVGLLDTLLLATEELIATDELLATELAVLEEVALLMEDCALLTDELALVDSPNTATSHSE